MAVHVNEDMERDALQSPEATVALTIWIGSFGQEPPDCFGLTTAVHATPNSIDAVRVLAVSCRMLGIFGYYRSEIANILRPNLNTQF